MRVLSKISVVGVLLSAVFYLGSCGGGGGGGVGTSAVSPSGSGFVTLDPNTGVLTGSFVTTNVANAVAAHIHDGNVGVAGPIVVPLALSAPGSATWAVPANAIPLTVDRIARLQAGGYYVNVHTTLNPLGEIRGQLTPDGAIANKFNANLTLAQEVPLPILPPGAAY